MEISSSKENNYVINISILGKSGTGKTATIVKLLTKRFIGEYSSVIDDKYFFTLFNDSKDYYITIQDTTDQSDIDLDHIVKWSHIIVVMFSIIDRSSFNKALILLQLITDECLKREEKYDVSICLVANKVDLNRFRVVLSDECLRLTKEFPISYYESSVIYSHSVIEHLFLQIIKNYLNDEDEISQQESPNNFLREKSSSPFTNVGMLGPLVRRQSTKNLRNSVTSINDSQIRRNSIENGRRIRNAECDFNISSSKTSLNNLFNSSTKRIKAEGFKFFKRPK